MERTAPYSRAARWRRFVLALAVGAVVFGAGCSRADSPTATGALDPPAQAVQDLLELRIDRSSDASAYAEYLTDPEVAAELAASDAEGSDRAVAPVPAWQEPYVAVLEADRAEVTVVWIPDEEHPDWPFATVFVMQRIGGMWKAGDAQALGADEVPPPLGE